MNLRRVAAGILGLADAVLGLYVGYAFPTPLGILLGLSFLLLVGTLFCFYGVRLAFLAAAVLSIILPGASTLAPSLTLEAQVALLVVSLASMGANVLAFRSTTNLSEQANPMNLPVFG